MNGISPPHVELFETSLRDGMQQPNIDISVPNAVSLLERMGAFGVHYAEIGFAGANQFVTELTAALDSVDTGAMKLALFGRTRGRGTRVEDWPDVQFIVARKQRVPVAVLVVKSRLLDVHMSLETTPEENLLMAQETIACLQDKGLEVIVDFEHAMDADCGRRENGNPCDADFSSRSLDYFHQLTAQCVSQKVSRIVICDTTGGASPEEVTNVLRRTYAHLSRSQLRISRPHRPRPGRCQYPRRHSGRRRAGAGHAARHRRALRQRQPDHRHRQHATARRSASLSRPNRSPGLPAWRTRPTRPSRWRRRTARPSSAPAHSAPGPACTAAASARTPARISGAIPRWSAPTRSSASTRNREEPTLFCSPRRWAFRSTPRRRRP